MVLEHTNPTGIGKDHTEDDQGCNDTPDPLHGLFRTFIKEKAHVVALYPSLRPEKSASFRYNGHMFDFQQRRKLRGVLASRFTQGAILAITCLIALSAFERYQIAMEMRERRELVEAEAAALEARRDELEREVRYLSSERGIEAEMRRQFDVAQEGEQVVVILDEEESSTTTTPVEPPPTPPDPWYQFWR